MQSREGQFDSSVTQPSLATSSRFLTGVLLWPALSSDANPIEYGWDMLGRRIRSRVRTPLNLNE
nr:unnamed protein product [Callosobruchus chinensis]